jgi:hypothetical protein
MLKSEIEEAKRTVTTDRVSVSVGEVSTMYKNHELNILPDFQRLFRWSIDKKSNFIESILIGIPVPPVFVFETDQGTWELVDGLQRISTILEFMGLLRDVDNPGQFSRSVLSETKYLPSLKGVAWDAENQCEVTLEKSLQLFFRRARLDFEILKHPSDPTTKYDLFQRLNRGGAYANEQEVRTCSMVLADENFTNTLKIISSQYIFQNLFKVTEEQRQKQKDLEYVVRMIVHTFVDYDRNMDIEEFLSGGILEVIETGKQQEAIDTVKWVIETLWRVGGEDALLPAAIRNEGVGGGRRFSLRALEVIAVGIARNCDAISARQDSDDFIRHKIAGFWRHQIAADLSGAGIRGTTRIQRSIPFGQQWFNPNAEDN